MADVSVTGVAVRTLLGYLAVGAVCYLVAFAVSLPFGAPATLRLIVLTVLLGLVVLNVPPVAIPIRGWDGVTEARAQASMFGCWSLAAWWLGTLAGVMADATRRRTDGAQTERD